MENMFIKHNDITKRNQATYDYKFYIVIDSFLNSEIKNLEEYVAWVYQWRAYEKELVTAIKYFRKMRIESTNETDANSYQGSKLALRKVARKFYEARTRNKELFKSKILPELMIEKEAA